MKRTYGIHDQRLTLYLPDSSVAGRVTRFTQTGLEAYLEVGEVPADTKLRFTLHMQGRVIAGEMTRLVQEGRMCRLQFSALTAEDRRRLEPHMDAD